MSGVCPRIPLVNIKLKDPMTWYQPSTFITSHIVVDLSVSPGGMVGGCS